MGRLRALGNQLTYANVTATVALFLALGGVSLAATGVLAPGSVGTAQLRTGAVTPAKLRFAYASGSFGQSGTTSIGRPPCPPGAAKCPPPSIHELATRMIRLTRAARLAIIATNLVYNADAAQTANVDLWVNVDLSSGTCDGYAQVPSMSDTTVSCAGTSGLLAPGWHAVTIIEEASGASTAGIEAEATDGHLVWWTLPPT